MLVNPLSSPYDYTHNPTMPIISKRKNPGLSNIEKVEQLTKGLKEPLESVIKDLTQGSPRDIAGRMLVGASLVAADTYVFGGCLGITRGLCAATDALGACGTIQASDDPKETKESYRRIGADLTKIAYFSTRVLCQKKGLQSVREKSFNHKGEPRIINLKGKLSHKSENIKVPCGSGRMMELRVPKSHNIRSKITMPMTGSGKHQIELDLEDVHVENVGAIAAPGKGWKNMLGRIFDEHGSYKIKNIKINPDGSAIVRGRAKLFNIPFTPPDVVLKSEKSGDLRGLPFFSGVFRFDLDELN